MTVKKQTDPGPSKLIYVTCIMVFFIPFIQFTLCQLYSFTSRVLFTKNNKLWNEKKKIFLFLWMLQRIVSYQSMQKIASLDIMTLLDTCIYKQPILTKQRKGSQKAIWLYHHALYRNNNLNQNTVREVIYLGHTEVLEIAYVIIKIQQLRFHFNYEKKVFSTLFKQSLTKYLKYLVLVSFNLGFEKLQVEDYAEQR